CRYRTDQEQDENDDENCAETHWSFSFRRCGAPFGGDDQTMANSMSTQAARMPNAGTAAIARRLALCGSSSGTYAITERLACSSVATSTIFMASILAGPGLPEPLQRRSVALAEQRRLPQLVPGNELLDVDDVDGLFGLVPAAGAQHTDDRGDVGVIPA